MYYHRNFHQKINFKNDINKKLLRLQMETKFEEESQNCRFVFREGPKKGEKCTNKFSLDSLEYGKDRYCSSCRSTEPVKNWLKSEIQRKCYTYDCPEYVLNRKRLPPMLADNFFCECCLSNLVLRKELCMLAGKEPKMEPEYKREKEIFIHEKKYTSVDLENFFQLSENSIYLTKLLSEQLSEHLRYLIEVLYSNRLSEISKVLNWATTITHERWDSIHEKNFLGTLMLLKHRLSSEIVVHLKRMSFPHSKKQIIEKIRSKLASQSYEVSNELLEMFFSEFRRIRDLNHPFALFISEKIIITKNKKDFLFTESLYNEFCKWELANEREGYSNSCISFGIELKKFIKKNNFWTVGKYGPKTSHIGIKFNRD